MKILHIGPVKNNNKNSGEFEGLEISSGIGADGPSRSILSLIDSLSQLDISVGLLSTKEFNRKSDTLPKKVKYLKPYIGRKYNFFINSNKWINYIEKEFGVPDIVNFHDVYDLFSISLARKMKKIGWNYFVTPRGGLREYAQKRDKPKKIIANKLFFNSYLEGASFIHALTKEEAKDIQKFNKKLNKLIIVPNGLPKNIYEKNNYFNISKKTNDKIIVGFIGQLFTEIKGVDLLLDAISLFQKNQKNILDFVFIGPVQKKHDQKIINSKMKNIPLKDSIFFKGPMFGGEKWNELASFDVFVLPSRTEGMPIVGLEAMAFGKPCLFTTGTNMVDFINQANGGWGVEPDKNEIYKKLVVISKTPRSILNQMGNNSRNYFIDNFTSEIVSKKYLNSIKDLLNT